jgi:hypothetical protein
MTSRRCIVLEEGVRELLELNHYAVRIVPVWYTRHFPPAHLVASRGPGETRYIRIKKVSRRPRTIRNIETTCRNEIVQYRKILSGPAGGTGLHCEIWIYSLYDGYHCFEVLTGSVREIPKLAPDKGVPLPDREGSS